MAEWAGPWLKTKIDLRASSRARLVGVLDTHVLPTFGANELRGITNSAVRSWVAGMIEGGSSPATARKAFDALNQMMRSARADRRVNHNPCDDVPLPSVVSREQRFLTAGEVALLADCIDPRSEPWCCWRPTGA